MLSARFVNAVGRGHGGRRAPPRRTGGHGHHAADIETAFGPRIAAIVEGCTDMTDELRRTRDTLAAEVH